MKDKAFQKAKKPLEESIESQILYWLDINWVSVEKVSSEWYYNAEKKFYQKRKSPYSRSGTADIHGCIPDTWRALYIEVKKPSEMSFFDKPVHVLQEELIKATYDKKLSKSSLKRYNHALEQAMYIEDKIKHGAVAFYASSTDETIQKLKNFWISIT